MGNRLGFAGIRVPVLERLAADTDFNSGADLADGLALEQADGLCWTLERAVNRHGYVRCRDDSGRTVYAHRVAYRLLRGPIGGMDVHHICGNRRCWNPNHLELREPGEHRMYAGWFA